MKKSSRSFEIALSATAAAVGAVFLMLGSLSPGLLAAGYLIAAFALMLPLTKGFVFGSALAYLAAGLLSVFVSLWKIVPYAVFFGLHPIVNYLQKKYVKRTPLKAVCLLGKTIWFDFSMWLSFFVLTRMAGMVFPAYVETYFYLILFLGGSIFFWVYDLLMFYCQKSADLFVRRIRR